MTRDEAKKILDRADDHARRHFAAACVEAAGMGAAFAAALAKPGLMSPRFVESDLRWALNWLEYEAAGLACGPPPRWDQKVALLACVAGPETAASLCGDDSHRTIANYAPVCPKCATILAWNDGTVPRMAQEIYDTSDWGRLPVLADALEDAGLADSKCPECAKPDHKEVYDSGLRKFVCAACKGKRAAANPIIAHLRLADLKCPVCDGAGDLDRDESSRGDPVGYGPCRWCKGGGRLPTHCRGCWVLALILGKE